MPPRRLLTAHTATITDDDSKPVVTPAQSFTVDENKANGLQVGTVIATDRACFNRLVIGQSQVATLAMPLP